MIQTLFLSLSNKLYVNNLLLPSPTLFFLSLSIYKSHVKSHVNLALTHHNLLSSPTLETSLGCLCWTRMWDHRNLQFRHGTMHRSPGNPICSSSAKSTSKENYQLKTSPKSKTSGFPHGTVYRQWKCTLSEWRIVF